MKAIHWIIGAAAFASVQPAQAGVNSPEVIIYRVSGVRDDGGPSFTGVATVFHCTNFSGVDESIRIVIRNAAAAIVVNSGSGILPHLNTVTFMTHGNRAYGGANLVTGVVQGSAAIAATSVNVVCTAMTIDASLGNPVGVPLHMVRFNPIPASQE
jgi:hypothetical protein